MSLANRWTALASRLGTSPRQLALLLLSAVAAIGIFAGKLVMAPKAASAAPAASPATLAAAPVAASASASVPAEFMGTMPRWNLATTPSRSPFEQPAEARPAVAPAAGPAAAAPKVAPGVTLQATLDGIYAVLDGRTLRVGQSWTDPKTGHRYQLMKVGQRAATLASGADEYEIQMDLVLGPNPQ